MLSCTEGGCAGLAGEAEVFHWKIGSKIVGHVLCSLALREAVLGLQVRWKIVSKIDVPS